jgi:3',5'-cyclic AMP phosphodiesterase CpdA
VKILHISDAHFGLTSPDASRDVIQAALLDIASSLDFQVVVFSGDIANRGATVEYRQAGIFLSQLAAGKPVLAVPGNHDVDRGAVHGSLLVDAAEDREKYLSVRTQLEEPSRFDAFRAFATNYQFDWGVSVLGAVTTIDAITYIGVNTALLSHRDVDEQALAIDERYTNERLVAAAAGGGPVVAIGHHPLSWLSVWNRTSITEALGRRQRGAHLYLHGHLHTPEGSAVSTVEGQKLVTIQAGAAYQDAPYEKSFWLIDVMPELDRIKPYLYKYQSSSGSFILDNFKSHVVVCDLGRRVDDDTHKQPAVTAPLPQGVRDLASALDDQRYVVWEPGGITDEPNRLFWPVRLRRPTPIHAAQAFVAAAIQKRGVAVTLCLDTFGNVVDADISTFSQRMSKHFAVVGADWGAVEVLDAQNLLSESALNQTWKIQSSWLSKDGNRLGDVLAVCKLLDLTADDLGQVVSRKPRKLMTPAVVWSCFESTRRRSGNGTSFLTLGGWDERALWAAWRRVLGIGSAVGHIYVPELRRLGGGETKALVMADEPIHWDSRDDILASLHQDAAPPSDASHLAGWLLRHCLLFPNLSQGRPLRLLDRDIRQEDDIRDLDMVDRPMLDSAIATRAREFLLQ